MFEESPLIGQAAIPPPKVVIPHITLTKGPAVILAKSQWVRDPGISELIDHLDNEDRFDLGAKDPSENFSKLTAAEAKEIFKIVQNCRADFSYASRNFFWINTKKRGDKLFQLWESQELIYEHMLRMKARGIAQKIMIIKARQLGALDPETKVLDASLQWVKIDTLNVGDEVVSVDEYPCGGIGTGRKFRAATVLNKWSVHKEAFRLTLDNGREIIATADHPFLCKKRGAVHTEWRTVKKIGTKKSASPIRPGDQIRFVADTWEAATGFEDGWFAGPLDGEGSYRAKRLSGMELNVSQVEGPVLERARAYLVANGYGFHTDIDNRKNGVASKLGNKPVHKFRISTIPQVLRAVGALRPARFVSRRLWEGKELPSNGKGKSWAVVVSVESVGVRRMVDIETTTKTFIAEGLVTHNCSTLIEGLIAWKSMFFKNVNALVISYSPSHAAYLFGLMQYIYDRMPWWLKPMCSSREYKDGLKFENPNAHLRRKNPGLNSTVTVEAANKRTGVGQGLRIGAAHFSEFTDTPPDTAREIIEADMGNALAENEDTFAILESTAKNAGSYTHKLWKKNIQLGEKAEWETIFLPWFFDSGHYRPLPRRNWKPEQPEADMRDRVLNDWLRCDNKECEQYQQRYLKSERDRSGDQCPTCRAGVLHPYTLTDEQMHWMEFKRTNASKDDESLKQLREEQCVSSEEAWQISGVRVFGEKAQNFVNSTVCTPSFVGFMDSDGRFHAEDMHQAQVIDYAFGGEAYFPCLIGGCKVNHHGGDANNEQPLSVWCLPEPEGEYVVGCDVAGGGGGEADFSVAFVLKVGRGGGRDEQVAVFRSNITEPIEFAYIINSLGRWYNNAMVAIEVNKFDTTATYVRMQCQYPNLYRWKHMDSLNILSNKFGWETNQNSKQRLYHTLQRWLNTRMIIIHDSNFAEEMKTFQKEDYDDRSAEAGQGAHDDSLMAGMIALFTAHEADWNDSLGYITMKRDMTMDSAPWHCSCMRCGNKWASANVSQERHCETCGSLLVSATRNVNYQEPERQDPKSDLLDFPEEETRTPVYEEL